MKWNTFAEKFPLLDGEERAAFLESLRRTGGNSVPVLYRVVRGEREGLDGRNRYQGCEELGLPCRAEEVQVDDEDVKEFILIRNLHRRHLTPELRRELVAELRADGLSERRIAKVIGACPATIHRDLTHKQTPASNEAPDVSPCQDSTHKESTAQKSGDSDNSSAAVTGRDGKTYPAKSRAERVGQKAPESFVVKDREPGDDTDHIAADRERQKKLPRPGAVLFAWGPFEAAYGQLVRQVDALGKAYRAKESDDANGLRQMLRDFHARFKAWHKKLTGGARR